MRMRIDRGFDDIFWGGKLYDPKGVFKTVVAGMKGVDGVANAVHRRAFVARREGGVAEGGAVLATQQRAGLKHGGMTTGTGWRRNNRLRVFMGPQA